MKQLYVSVLSEEKAWELSQLFYKLTNLSGGGITQYYSEPIINPVTNEVRLPINSNGFYIHPNADKHLLDDYLQVFVTMSLMTPEEIINIQNLIEESRGTRVNLQEALPLVWYTQLKTLETLIAEGWFPNTEVI